MIVQLQMFTLSWRSATRCGSDATLGGVGMCCLVLQRRIKLPIPSIQETYNNILDHPWLQSAHELML